MCPLSAFYPIRTSNHLRKTRQLPQRRKLRFSQNCALTRMSQMHTRASANSYGVQSGCSGGGRGFSSDQKCSRKAGSQRQPSLYPYTITMAALSAVAPVLNKAPAVSTGKAANTNSMMVWQPHGNKCVRFPAFPRSPARPRLSFASRARDLRRRRALRRRGSRRSLP